MNATGYRLTDKEKSDREQRQRNLETAIADLRLVVEQMDEEVKQMAINDVFGIVVENENWLKIVVRRLKSSLQVKAERGEEIWHMNAQIVE